MAIPGSLRAQRYRYLGSSRRASDRRRGRFSFAQDLDRKPYSDPLDYSSSRHLHLSGNIAGERIGKS